MTKSEFFSFEKEDLDFPFYKSNDLSLVEWIVLTLSFVITGILICIPPTLYPGFLNFLVQYKGFLYFLIPFLGILFASKGKLDSICKKLSLKDGKLIVILLVLSAIYSVAMGLILRLAFNIIPNANPVFNETPTLLFWIQFFFQLFGEELIILIPFLIVLFLVYKFSQNRKLGIIIGVLVSLFIFGILHFNAYHSFISIIMIQGVGSIIRMYGYLKTKNILVTYLIHVLFDLMFIIPGILFLIHFL